MRLYRIAVVPGDGIGKEVVPEGLRLLEAVERKAGGFHCEPTHFPWGSDYYRAHGVMMPEDGNETLKPYSPRSSSARWATRSCPTTSRSGACG